jgi:glutamate-ammonia-ligase adenylyltransferase
MPHDNVIPFDPAALSAQGIQDAQQAARNLELIRARIGTKSFTELSPEILSLLKRTSDPDMALNHLERFLSELDPVAQFVEAVRSRPAVLPSLMVLFGASRFLSAHVIATAAETFSLLSNTTYLAYPADRGLLEDRLLSILQGATKDEDLFRALRIFRKREMLRIALRDLLGSADLAETVGELSNLAEVTLQAAYEWCEDELRRKHGKPLIPGENGSTVPAGFAVIAMGKLGGRELNFSSDIDLMYVYTADGETEGVAGPEGAVTNRVTNHQYYVKLAEMASAAIGRNTADGFVFRVDLRLRPEGQRGPIAQTLGGYEIYYESWGQTWERSALIKARPVAGDEAVGREFLDRIAPFVYRKYLDFGAIVEIREMKQKINREVELKGRTHRDVKLGYGGIREIEFLVQALQLIYGGRDRTVRERGTMKALHALAQKGLLTYQEIADLSKAYVFLRTVEHRLQMLNDLQTQTLPTGDAELRALARRSGYLDAGRETETLLRDYAEHTRKVRDIYDNLLSQAPEGPAEEETSPDFAILLDPQTGEQDARPILVRYGFRDPERAYRNIALLREGQAFVHQTPRSRRVFHELFPALFREITEAPDPDMALHNLESYLASQGSWDAFQAIVRQDPRVPHALVSVFGNSEYFSRMLVRTPGIIGELLEEGEETGLGSARFFEKGLAGAVRKAATITDKLDAVRRFKHREELRIGMADLTGTIPLPAVCRTLSRLADACLGTALTLAIGETERKCGIGGACTGLAVVGAGKLGGRELIYGSDLDILFVYDEARTGASPSGLTVFEFLSKVAEKTISYLTTMTREGAAYRVDTRLRPTGSKGPLVQSIEAFRNYFATQADTWERQALLHARVVAGDREAGRRLLDMLREILCRDEDPAELASSVRAMRKRMEEELGKEDARQYNIKQGTGGLVDIEFLAQYLQLRHGRKRPRLRVPGTINALLALKREGLLPPREYETLEASYFFLRRLESRLRVVANQSKSLLPREPEKIRSLGKRLGYEDAAVSPGEALLADFQRIRKEVRDLYERLLVV